MARTRAAEPPQVPWVESPELEAYIARAHFDAATEAFVRSLARHGYALVDLGDEARALCDQAVADTEPLFESHPGANRIQDAWMRSPAVRQLAAWPRIAQLLKSAYGREAFAFQTLNFRRGSEQSLHPDTIHFHSLPERFMCGVWLALEDVGSRAGPLVYRPGSHRLPVMTMQDAGLNTPQAGHDDYERLFVPRYADRLDRSGLPVAHAVIKKGWAFVWAANLAHGGSPVAEPGSTRRSLVTHWYFEDCLYYTPLTSDPAAGRLSLRLPLDVRSGGVRWPRRDGRRVFPGMKPTLFALWRLLSRRPQL